MGSDKNSESYVPIFAAYDLFEGGGEQLLPSDLQTFYAEIKEMEPHSTTVEGIPRTGASADITI